MMTLYGNPFSANVKRVLVTLAEVGLDAKHVNIDLSKGEQHAPDFVAKNPNTKVPVLTWDGRHLWESTAIIWELAKAHPNKGLLPTNDRDHAEALRWMFWNASHLESPVSAVVWERVLKVQLTNGQTDEARVTEQMKNVERFLQVLNGHLLGRQWLAGSAFSIADITVAVTVNFGGMASITVDAYPNVKAWFTRVTARPSWSVAWQGK